MQDDLAVRGITIPANDLDWRFTGSGGPGGQHANTSNTAVELRLDVRACDAIPERIRDRIRARLGNRMTTKGELVVTAADHRSQHRNRQEALKRMAELLDEGIRPPAKRRKPTRPTRGSQRRRLESKRRRGELKAARQNDWR